MATDTKFTQSGDETIIDLPPLGLRGGSPELIGWFVAYAIIALFALSFWIPFVIRILIGDRDGLLKQLPIAALATVFLSAAVYLGAKLLSVGRRNDRIRVSDRELTAESRGLFRKRRLRWTRDQIDLIRATWIGLPVNGIVLTALEVHADGKSEVLAVQRSESELARICHVLGERLGIQTGDNWRPGSTDRRPIPAPSKTDIELNGSAPGRLSIRVPLRGRLPGVLSAWCGFGILALLVAAFVYHRLWIAANWNLQTVPLEHIALLVSGVALLWVLRRALISRFAARLRVNVGEGELSIVKPGWFRTTNAAWPLNQIQRVGVQFLLLSGYSGFGTRPVLQLFLQTSNGREPIVRLDDLSRQDRRREYEFYWLADQIQRSLG